MDFWICRECGIKNQNSDQFCSNCGNKHIVAAYGNGIDKQITGNYQENESSQVEIPTKRKELSATPRKHWLSRLVGILVAYVLLVGGFWGFGYITCQYDIASFGLAFLPIPGYSRDVLLHNLYAHCYDMEVQVNFIADGVVQHTKTARVKDGSSVSPYTFSMSDYELANPGEVVIRKDEYGNPVPSIVNYYLVQDQSSVVTPTHKPTGTAMPTATPIPASQREIAQMISVELPSSINRGESMPIVIHIPSDLSDDYRMENDNIEINFYRASSRQHERGSGYSIWRETWAKSYWFDADTLCIEGNGSRYLSPGKYIVEFVHFDSDWNKISTYEQSITINNTSMPSAPKVLFSSNSFPLERIEGTFSYNGVEEIEIQAYNTTESQGTWKWSEWNGMIVRSDNSFTIDASGYPRGEWQLHISFKIDNVWTDTVTYKVKTH